MTPPTFHLDQEGYFSLEGARVIPVGVNYWPGSCGVEMWRVWPAAEIQHDLDAMVRLGLNCVRFFVRWQDFEPERGHYNETAFQRFTEFLEWCQRRQLLAHPTLMVGWMSGGIFWPDWKGERNLYSDPGHVDRASALAERIAKLCASFQGCVLAVDLGNELCCLPDCASCQPEDVKNWCAAMTAAVRRGFPGALVISGNEQNQVANDTGWRFGAQPGCDLYSMHTYPNSAWHPLAFDGMTDPLAQSLLPFYVKCARAFGPVFAQEFGTIFTSGECCDEYLRAMLPATWDAGANGFLWWGLRDFESLAHPYNKNAFEGPLGLLAEDDTVKPVLGYFSTFCASLAQRPPARIDEGEVALYWPRHYYSRGDAHNPGNEPALLSRRLAIAHFTLGQLGYRVGIVRGDRPLFGISAHTIVVTGAALTAEEVGALTAWVHLGGRLIYHGIDLTTWGARMSALVGATAADLRTPHATFQAFGRVWTLRDFPRRVCLEVIPQGACVVAADELGRPIILSHKLGRGMVVCCLGQIDDAFAAESENRANRPEWKRWYQGMLALTSSEANGIDLSPAASATAALERSGASVVLGAAKLDHA